ncbi:hypothetical protein MGYG_00696 [Nannizzia gypsea CBS 118893]|uniref:Tat pathway signal sequence n=1 Tax=Arthroderma gypseum (strain ATCC MYA-4604 / CBS 118893) TaxID=535722 RepID=E5R1A5_ARTGP|nr:hypothetical protein MGYG_00696 [Nannizzia gypsea CBS 118893]EFQ97656.1 hypothetical protein MGYG_00696 [Nannizzia gypsea CBS 118893]
MSRAYPAVDDALVDDISYVTEGSRVASPSSSTSLGGTVTPSFSSGSLTGSDALPNEDSKIPSRTASPASSCTRLVPSLAREEERATFANSADAAERAEYGTRMNAIHRVLPWKFDARYWGLLLLMGLAFWAGMKLSPQRECKIGYPDIVYSPARGVQDYLTIRFDGGVQTINLYKGVPSKELDEAWKALYDIGPLLVDKKELEAIGKESIELPSRPGKHLAKLAVFHQLHCLDYVRRYVHREHYRIDDSHATISGIDHADHCIDMIRQALSCSADPTLITFNQKSPFHEVEADFSATHACTNFEKVHGWAKNKAINMTEEIIRNPGAFKEAAVTSLHS